MWKPQIFVVSNKLLKQSSDFKKIARYKVDIPKKKGKN